MGLSNGILPVAILPRPRRPMPLLRRKTRKVPVNLAAIPTPFSLMQHAYHSSVDKEDPGENRRLMGGITHKRFKNRGSKIGPAARELWAGRACQSSIMAVTLAGRPALPRDR